MSDQKQNDPAPEQPEGQATEPKPSVPQKSSGRTRQLVLVALLALMLGALWYDYKVARPNVDAAYDLITQLNYDNNADSSKGATSNLDVQEAIGKKPAKSFKINEDAFVVEVYSWMAGLPFRTHDLYAVYTSRSGQNVFMRHYKFKFDEAEFAPQMPSGVDVDDDEASTELPPPPAGFGGGPRPRGPRGAGRRGDGEKGRPKRPEQDDGEQPAADSDNGSEGGDAAADDAADGDAAADDAAAGDAADGKSDGGEAKADPPAEGASAEGASADDNSPTAGEDSSAGNEDTSADDQ